jgi:hypothetical protein
MARSLLEKAREERTLDRRGYPCTLGQLFPHADPRSPAMWRLAIIRDDLDFEVNGVAIPEEADAAERVWQHSYFLRRLSISILEAKNVFVAEMEPMLNESGGLLGGGMREPVVALASRLREIEPMIKPLRDALGAHVRPNNANPDKTSETYDVLGLRAHAKWEGTITLNRVSLIGTTYREFTQAAYLFAWPDVTDDDALVKHAAEFQPMITRATAEVARAIDGVLYAFWMDLKAFTPLR